MNERRDSSSVPATMGALVESVRRLLRGAVERPADEADWLVARALRLTRSELLGQERRSAPEDGSRLALAWAERRRQGEPLAYVLGEQEFFGRLFHVDRAVLIPRPDTEVLVEELLAEPASAGWAVDVGTGSGALALTLSLEAVGGPWLGLDLSGSALEVARRNARQLGAQVRFVRGDLLSAVRGPLGTVVANLPYVSAVEFPRLAPEVLRWEPGEALAAVAGDDVDSLRRRLVQQAAERLVTGGLLALEVGAGQAGRARDDLRGAGFGEVRVRNDLAGIGRVVRGRLLRRRSSSRGSP